MAKTTKTISEESGDLAPVRPEAVPASDKSAGDLVTATSLSLDGFAANGWARVLDAVRDLADVLKDTLPENHRDAASKVVHEIDKLRGHKTADTAATESQGE